MVSENAQVIANRDTPIPLVPAIKVDTAHGSAPSDSNAADQDRSRGFSASKLKEKLESIGDSMSRESPTRVGDKMMNLLLSQILPLEDLQEEEDTWMEPRAKDRRSASYVEKPNFSIPTMSSRFRRFNARIGVVFVFQNRLIHLFSWQQPTQTIAFLLIWTFLCIDPYLMPVVPLASAMFFIMVPAYLARHPEPENTGMDVYVASMGGPPLRDPKTIKPAPEFSKDFLRNMRDLQNSMNDFSNLHDAVLAILQPLTNFSNEALSSTIYLLLLLVSCGLFLSAHLLPWRFIFLAGGYAMTAAGHPFIQSLLLTPEAENLVAHIEHKSRSLILTVSKADIELETTSETRQVEIFELQHRSLHDERAEYERFTFSPSPYSPLSPARISGDRPRGTPFFEDVLPPRGWRWSDKKWTLDLLSQEWVEDRCVTGVEVEIEGERWVTDLHYEASVQEGGEGSKRKGKHGSRGVGEEEKEVLERTWDSHKPSRKGEWRRRRWIRGVERMPAMTV